MKRVLRLVNRILFRGEKMSKIIKLPQYKWSAEEKEIEYHLTDTWDVTTYNFAGANRPVMTQEQIKAALASPIGSPRIKELARGKKKVVIIFEDMTRPARVYRVVPAILEELKEGGINDEQIEFICANGAHQGWTLTDFQRKLGADIVAKYPVYNHFAFMNTTPLGKTSYGSRVEVNTEVMSCDLKITLGGTIPHGSLGFGGGGKTVMPGVSSYDAIYEHHAISNRTFNEQRRRAGFVHNRGFAEGNPLTLDALEMAKMAKIDFIINIMQNYWGEPVVIKAGALEPTYWAAVKEAKSHYLVTCPSDNDIVIANAFSKSNEATGALVDAMQHVKRSGGSGVLVTNTAFGQICHYLGAAWGKSIGGRGQSHMAIPAHVNHAIIYSEFREARFLEAFAEKDLPKITYLSNWTDVVLELYKWHGAKAKVAVFTDGIIQISSVSS